MHWFHSVQIHFFVSRLFLPAVFLLSGTNSNLFAQILVDTSKRTPAVIKELISGDGSIQISRIQYTGNKYSLGLFNTICREVPLRKGIILSTGDIWDARGPNDMANAGAYHYRDGDPDLSPLGNGKTYDAAILEFDFLANTDSMLFSYFFASEEYPEYVNRGVNDVFAFFVTDSSMKRNIALVNHFPVSINTINSKVNGKVYMDNPRIRQGPGNCLSSALQFDGLTRKLYAGLRIQPYHLYHFKFAIADVGDGYFDSAIFLCAGSFASRGTLRPDQVVNVIKSAGPEMKVCLDQDSSHYSFVPNVEFDFDSWQLPESAYPILLQLVKMMGNLYDFKLKISGYADNTGSDEYNLKLSGKRAQAIADFLIRYKIAPDRIEVEAKGKADPIADNLMESGRAQNRRAVFQLYK